MESKPRKQYLKELTPGYGNAYPNRYKYQPNHPDITGFVRLPRSLGAVLLRIAGWAKKTQAGHPALSLNVTVLTDDWQFPYSPSTDAPATKAKP